MQRDIKDPPLPLRKFCVSQASRSSFSYPRTKGSNGLAYRKKLRPRPRNKSSDGFERMPELALRQTRGVRVPLKTVRVIELYHTLLGFRYELHSPVSVVHYDSISSTLVLDQGLEDLDLRALARRYNPKKGAGFSLEVSLLQCLIRAEHVEGLKHAFKQRITAIY